jgi:TPP-dependent pyruvate/acetoin dehydrogenase alpha subunit
VSKKDINFQKRLLDKLIFIRKIEENISIRYKDQQMRCPVHLSIGQEASAIGVCENLEKEDILFSGHRSHAHYLARDCDPQKMIDEIHGKITGCVGGRGGSMHLQDLSKNFYASIPIVGSALGLAVGTALNQMRKNKKGITIVFFGDGAIEEGIFHESMNMATIFELPILFVCENNFYSIYTHINQRQPSTDMTRFAKPHKIKSLRTNGYDVENVYNKAKIAVDFIKKNRRPYFLQLDNYRYYEHCGPNKDDHKNYRPIKELNFWRKKDPLTLYEKKLLNKSIISMDSLETLHKSTQIRIDKIFQKSLNAPLPKPSQAKSHVYA